MPPARIIPARTLPHFPAVTCLIAAAIQTAKNKKPVMIRKDARQSRNGCRTKFYFYHYVGSRYRRLNKEWICLFNHNHRDNWWHGYYINNRSYWSQRWRIGSPLQQKPRIWQGINTMLCTSPVCLSQWKAKGWQRPDARSSGCFSKLKPEHIHPTFDLNDWGNIKQ